MTLLSATGIRKAYPGVQALDGVDLAIQSGEIHALVGENGAGKSTLIRIMTGAEVPDAGRLEVGGGRYEALDPELARRLGIAVIYQQPLLFGELSVAENLALGLEPPRLWRRVDHRARRERARELLQGIGSSLDPDRLASSLSLAEQQLVAIARALGAETRVLVLDEPTACLTDRDTARLHELLRALRLGGVGVVYITHRLEELPGLADRVTVLRDGRTMATLPIAEAAPGALIRLMVGRDVAMACPARVRAPGEPVLSVQDLGCRATGLHEVSFDLREGEVLGVAGLVGSGRTELARALFGLTPADQGEIRVLGQTVRIHDPREAVAAGLAYVPEDRRRYGVIGPLSVLANVSLATLDRVQRGGLIDPRAELAAAAPLGRQLAVKTPSWYAAVGNLSGGNQQKVALARWLAADPEVLVVDEPTQGIDVGAKAEIHRILANLAEEGKAILLISSDLPEVLGLSDRVAVMARGTMVAVLERGEATPERVLALALGQAAEVAA